MCGHQKNFSINGFELPNLESFVVLKHYPDKNSDLKLKDMTRIDELKQFEQHISTQCSEIAKNLAVK